MKSTKRKNIRNNKISDDFVSILIITLVIASVAAITTFILISKLSNNDSESIQDYNIWDAEFNKLNNTPVGVVFNEISTSEKEYDLLRDRCQLFLASIIQKDELDTTVNTDVKVDEEQFVDGEKTNDYLETNIIDNRGLVETGPIYSDNMIIIRYVNESGELAVVSSAFIGEPKTSSNVEIYKQSGIREYIGNNIIELTGEVDSSDTVSELKYVSIISDCIRSALKDRSYSNIQKLLPYFTKDGKDTVINAGIELGLTSATNIVPVLGIAGKSDTSKNLKDRVYLQFDIVNGTESSTINIIVKLNEYLRIFDIDII
ncbi:MAG: hypothetical protein IJ593_04780 [Lachnospiraceae bacterium]|nr:hypothetical protein [Lachnospiraceae bacterium]